MTRIRMVVAYDGSGFHGFAVNDGVRTVAGELGGALGRFLGHEVELTVAGRTDAGVHARAQVVTFDVADDYVTSDLEALVRSVNHQCGPTVAAREAEVVPPEFDARFSARSRRYRYLVLNRPHPDPFLAAISWHVERPLDRWAMDLACDPFIGEHEFSAYCRRPKHRDGSVGSLVRRVKEATWTADGDGLLRFEIEASSFCHQMVRSIVGTMVAVGHGRLRAGDVAGIIRSGDRSKAGDLAPPQGLTLWSVAYDGWSS
jgi:tRNA pseudouridine38-40 synthase